MSEVGFDDYQNQEEIPARNFLPKFKKYFEDYDREGVQDYTTDARGSGGALAPSKALETSTNDIDASAVRENSRNKRKRQRELEFSPLFHIKDARYISCVHQDVEDSKVFYAGSRFGDIFKYQEMMKCSDGDAIFLKKTLVCLSNPSNP